MKETNELIIVKQLPIIEERLQELSAEIDLKVNNALSLIVSDETVKEVKNVRAELNKDFKQLEEQRKMVKEKVYAPYKAFEDIYKTYVSDKYKSADNELKIKIDTVENEQKRIKEEKVKEYFNELCEKENIDFLDYSRANINVTLTANMKSLQGSVNSFIDGVVNALNLIRTQEYSDEILIEYKKSLNISEAITKVRKRKLELEKILKEKEEQKQIQEASNGMLEKVNTISAPIIEEKEELLELTFKVRATKTKLKELKVFLDNGGYDYE